MSRIDLDALTQAMVEYYRGDIARINHFLKVTSFARMIAAGEGLDEQLAETVIAAALTHDIGIKLSEEKYHSSAGHYQQIEGPPEAAKMLAGLDCDLELADRICWLIAHHHDYASVSQIDHRILVEADFLVNAYESGLGQEAISNAKLRIFETATGLRLLDFLYGS
ncbi:MAG: HD domain-containing protein [Clostridiaceae bacterium]|nr:HD domain-containing protein [Clostridiaceae bacterium]